MFENLGPTRKPVMFMVLAWVAGMATLANHPTHADSHEPVTSGGR